MTISLTHADRPSAQLGAQIEIVHHAKWLGEIEVDDLKELLKPYPAHEMKLWPIGLRVNIPKNNDPDILMPIEA